MTYGPFEIDFTASKTFEILNLSYDDLTWS